MIKSNYQTCVEDIKKWALSMINCSHGACSMAEGVYEEIFGQQVLDIINKYIKETKL